MPNLFSYWKERLKIYLMTCAFYYHYRQFKNRGRRKNSSASVWICSGNEKQSGVGLRLLYSGNKHNLAYITRLMFSGETIRQSIVLESTEKLQDQAEKHACDVLFCEITHDNREPESATPFRIPIWIALSRDVSALEKGRDISDMRRCYRKNNLRYEFTRQKKDLLRFYTQLYVQFTQMTHGDEAFIHPFQTILNRIKPNSEFLLAFDQNELVGGVLIEYSSDEGRMSFMGAKDSRLKDGIISAILFRGMMRIHEKNCRIANLGVCRGFLTDGPLRYKAGFGSEIARNQSYENYWSMQILKPGTALQNFLTHNPFISIDPDGSAWGIFTEEKIDENIKRYALPGLQGIRTWSGDNKIVGLSNRRSEKET